MRPSSLFLLFQKDFAGKARVQKWKFTEEKTVAYDFFVIGMTAKGHKIVKTVTGCLW